MANTDIIYVYKNRENLKTLIEIIGHKVIASNVILAFLDNLTIFFVGPLRAPSVFKIF